MEILQEKQGRLAGICDKVINVSVAMIFFGLPLFFAGVNLQGIAFEKQLYFYFWLLVALVAWVVKEVVTGELKIRRTPLDFYILIFLLFYCLAAIFSVDRWHSFWGSFGDPSRGAVGVLALTIFYYLFLSNFDKERKINRAIISLVISNFALSLWTFLVLINAGFVPEKLYQILPISFVGSISGLTLMFSIMVPILVAAILQNRQSPGNGKHKQATFLFLFLVLLLNLFLLLVLHAFISWICWISLFAGMVLFLAYIFLKKIQLENLYLAWVPMLVLVVLAFFLISGRPFNMVKIDLPLEASLNYSTSWQIAKNSLKSNFFLGSGPATYGYDFSLFKPQDFNVNSFYNLRFSQGSGAIFEALPTIGIIGTFLLVLFAVAFLSFGLRSLAYENEADKIYSLGYFSASIIFLVNFFFFRTEGFFLILGSLIGVVCVSMLLKETESQGKYIRLPLKIFSGFSLMGCFATIIFTAGAILAFMFVIKTYAADIYAGSITASGEINEMTISRLNKSISLYSKEPRYYTELAQAYMYLANKERQNGDENKGDKLIQDYLNNSITTAAKAKEVSGKNVEVTEILAKAYENAGSLVPDSLNLAESAYQRALDLEPHNPDFLVKSGQIKLKKVAITQDDNAKKQLIEQARDLFQKSIDEKQNFSQGYYQLALTKDALRDVSGAIDSMTQALSLEKNNLNFAFNLAKLYQERGKEDDNKNAETLYRSIIETNENQINVRWNLGLLYEKTGRKGDALSEYNKVLNLLPDGSDQTKAQAQKMIDNIQSGIENMPEDSNV